jgi:hypothetical protein
MNKKMKKITKIIIKNPFRGKRIKPLNKFVLNFLIKPNSIKRINKKKLLLKFREIKLKFFLIIVLNILLISSKIETIKTIFFGLFHKSLIDYLNIYLVAHKDFNNILINQYYKIICDNKTQLQNSYQLEIIETNKNNELYAKRRGYCEGSKIYYIWKNYYQNKIKSKYIGFVHYSRVFNFANNIPNLDKIFRKHDIILNEKMTLGSTVKAQFAASHFGKFLDEIEDIIKENFTEYYPQTKKTLYGNILRACNIFIMKKEDFINYGKFVFGVLLEFDRRHNLKNDNDIKNLIASENEKIGNKTDEEFQSRQEGFLMERISSIYYDFKFRKSFEIPTKVLLGNKFESIINIYIIFCFLTLKLIEGD